MGPRPPASDSLTAVASAPCRVDLAGGTLDIWPLGLLQPSAVTVNVAIDLRMSVRVAADSHYSVSGSLGERRWESVEGLLGSSETALVGLVAKFLDAPPCRVEIDSGSPRGAGLGASSALAVALQSAFEAFLGRAESTGERRVAVARDIEAQLMGFPTGIQDHWPAVLGGCLAIHTRPGGAVVEPLEVDLDRLGAGLVVAFTGESHVSADTNWHIVRSRLNGDPKVRDLFAAIGGIAESTRSALLAEDWQRVGELMSEEWERRRHLSSVASTPGIELLLEAASSAGAWGGKACGAGGGGCIAVLGPEDRRREIEHSLEVCGAEVLKTRPTSCGLSREPT